MTAAPIPVSDAPALRPQARRLGRARLVLAAALCVSAALALAAAFRLRPTSAPLLPPTASGIVVLDVSASISSDTYARIAATLRRLVASNGRYGLVLFSDDAYQALPPGTPARELRPLLRFFEVPPQRSPGALPELPDSPWGETFSGGTRISTGLRVALDTIRADRLERPAVLLVSDLDDETGDLERVAQLGLAYRRAGIRLDVVGLNASPEDLAFVRRVLPPGGRVTQASLPGERGSQTRAGAPWALAVAAAALALVLAALLLITERMRWRARG
jgi:hypothetical protein